MMNSAARSSGSTQSRPFAARRCTQEIIRVAIAYDATNSHHQMLWFQEASQNQGFYFKQGNVQTLHEHLLKVLERGIAAGYFRPLDPFLALTHILSICIFYFTVHENWKHLTPQIERLSPEMVEKHTKEAIEFILAAVRNWTNVIAWLSTRFTD